MKKLILVLVIAIVPVMAFADFQIGATAVYNNDISNFSTDDVSDYLVYGLDVRLKIWIFQACASALYQPEYETVLLPTDLGLSFNLWFLRFGAGIGPLFGYTAGGEGVSMTDWWNLKAMADINIGNLTLGVVGYYFSADGLGGFRDSLSDPPLIGISVLFKLF